MTSERLLERLREVCYMQIPLPGGGETAERHRRLVEIGREDLTLARLAEAHFDAIAILAEAGSKPASGALYGVWAAETPGKPIQLIENDNTFVILGQKPFASGATLIDRALVTVEAPEPWLIDVDLRTNESTVVADVAAWKAAAFAGTKTATVDFKKTPIEREAFLGERGWYLSRPGFWHGACGPAACWAGGAIGLVDYALKQARCDPHTLAHLGAMEAAAWGLRSLLDTAGEEIDQSPNDQVAAHQRALRCRHLVEHLAADILERFGRAYGPYPLAFVDEVGTRYQELTIYLRQCHAERDLEALGRTLRERRTEGPIRNFRPISHGQDEL
jgi:alkylation response protein AidB-like acyl-CoA dehydrogenase